MKKSELRELYMLMFPDYPDILNVGHIQAMLGVSRHLAYDLINSGSISGIMVGHSYRIPKPNVIDYLMKEADLYS